MNKRRQREIQLTLGDSVEKLEIRVVPAYTATLNGMGNTATFIGDAGSDILTFDVTGGLLRHNRFTAGDPGFVSNLDFNTFVAGVQTLAANAANLVNVTDMGGGDDTLNLGTPAVSAGSLAAAFSLGAGGAGNDSLNINFSASGAGVGIAYNEGGGVNTITGGGLNLTVLAVLENPIGLTTTSFNDTVNVLSTFNAVSIQGVDGLDTVNIGNAGNLSGVAGAISIANSNSFTNININDSAGTVNRTVGLTGNTITGLGANVSFVAADIASVTIIESSRQYTYNAAGFQAVLDVVGGSGVSTLNLNAQNGSLVISPGDTTAAITVGTGPQINYTQLNVINVTNVGGSVTVDSFATVPLGTRLSRNATGHLVEFSNGVAPVSFAGGTGFFMFGGFSGDNFIIQETAFGLPSFGGTAPDAHTNTAFAASGLAPSNIGIHYNGFGGPSGSDLLTFNLIDAHSVAYFPDDDDSANSGVLNIAGAFTLSFEQISPVLINGAGGTLTVNGSALPGLTQINVADDGVAADGLSIITGDGGFESVTFGGFDSLVVLGGNNGADQTINLISLDSTTTLSSVTLAGGLLDGTDNATQNVLQIFSLLPGVALSLVSSTIDDFYVFGNAAPTVDNILGGPITVGDLGAAGGFDTIRVLDGGSAFDKTVTVTDTVISGLLGVPGNSPDLNYNGGDLVENVLLNRNGGGNSLNNEFSILSTAFGTTYDIFTDNGNDNFFITSGAPGSEGNLDGINGSITIGSGSGFDFLGVSDLTDDTGADYALNTVILGPDSRLTTLSISDQPATISYFSNTAPVVDDLEQFTLFGSRAGGNTYTINSTTATVSTSIIDGDGVGSGNSLFTIQADQLAPTADHLFLGFDGVDQFNIDMNGSFATGASFVVDGGGAPVGTRDIVQIDEGGVDFARTASFNYTPFGVDFQSFPGTTINLDAVESVFYDGQGAEDFINVFALDNSDDQITVSPFGPNQALVFLGGAPYSGLPENFFDQLPGVAGGGTLPDLRLSNLDNQNGLFIQGNATAVAPNNQLFFYGNSDANLFSALESGFDILGFGNGVVIPGLVDAWDDVTATDGLISLFNRSSGIQFVNVNYFTPDFVQTTARPGVFLNSGSEQTADPNGLADDIFVDPSVEIRYKVNGNEPNDPAQVTAPVGDRLNLFFSVVDVYSDQATPPNVTFRGSDPIGNVQFLPITVNEIENFNINATVVNLLGDNGDEPGIVIPGQNDEFTVTGLAGPLPFFNEPRFNLEINGSVPITFNNVLELNVTSFTGDDRTSIQPFATPNRPWGIDVFVDGGTGTDSLAYTGVDGQPDAITVEADANSAGRGRILDPGIVTNNVNTIGLNFINSERIGVNANPDDGDTLEIRTTNGDDTVTLLFDASPLGGKPGNAFLNGGVSSTPSDLGIADLTIAGRFDVSVDRGRGVLVRQADGSFLPDGPVANGFLGMSINLLQGADTVLVNLVSANVPGRPAFANGGGAGTLPLNVAILGGPLQPNLLNSIVIQGNTDVSDAFSISPKAGDPSAGQVGIAGFDSLGGRALTFQGIQSVTFDGRGGTGTDSAAVLGTDGPDTFTIANNVITSSALPAITLAAFGSTNSFVNLQTLAGDDVISISPLVGIGISVDAGDPTASDKVVVNGTAGNNRIEVGVVNAHTARLVLVDTGTNTIFAAVNVTNTELLVVDGSGGTDSLNIYASNPTTAQTYSFTPLAAPDAGLLRIGSLLPVQFQGIGVAGRVVAGDGVSTDADQLVYNGTGGPDIFTVSPANLAAISMVAGLSGAQEVPPNASVAAGSVSATLNATNNTINIEVFVTGIAQANLTASHIHVGAFGSNGPVIVNIGSGAAYTAVPGGLRITLAGLAVPAANLAAFLAGDVYVNVHSVALPGGEIRGQLLPVNSTIGLNASQEPHVLVGRAGIEALAINGLGSVDALVYNGSSANENFVVSNGGPLGNRVNLSGSAAGALQATGIEHVSVVGGGGSDTYLVDDLTLTELSLVDLNIGTTNGAVTLIGTSLDDNVAITESVIAGGGTVTVNGLKAQVRIAYGTPAPPLPTQTLLIQLGLGNDTLTAAAPLAQIGLTVDAGAGNDLVTASGTLLGGAGNDELIGLAGNDSIDGGAGDDTLRGGAGDDTLIGGDGNDFLRGGAGSNVFNGGAGFDVWIISETANTDGPNGVAITEGPAGTFAITTDTVSGVNVITNLELIDIYTSGGNDTVTTNSLSIPTRVDAGSGDDVVNLSFAAPDANAVPASATVYGGDGNDTITGTPAADSLFGGQGNDVISGLAGIDTLTGGSGNDSFLGGTGADLLFGEDGSDLFTWNNGDGSDLIEGGEDTDQVIVNGAAADEVYNISANIPRIQLTRTNQIPFTLDMADIERLDLNVLGGADTVNINDLTPTPLKSLNVDLGADGAAADVVNLNGGVAGDQMSADVLGGVITIGGLTELIRILNASLSDSLTMNGNAGNDTILAAPGVETTVGALLINGGSGNDELAGNCTINGGLGDDTIRGGASGNILNGDDGHDVIYGLGGNDTINGGAGNDLIFGEEGNDSIIAGTGDDTAFGGDGDDLIEGGAGVDSLDGGLGNDVLYAGFISNDPNVHNAQLTNDTLVGGDGNDQLHGSGGDNVSDGGRGNDTILGFNGQDLLIGGDGNDTIDASNGNDTVDGGFGEDTINAGSGNDSVNAGPGNDLVSLGDGDDFADGGDGNDTIDGSTGDDTINAGAGDDSITSGSGNDVVDAGKGTDFALLGDGDDTGIGGTGNDTICGENGNDLLSGNDGDDLILGGNDNDTITGGQGKDSILAGQGDDVVEGNQGDDFIDGGDGDDLLRGGEGRDLILGGFGNDTIYGGLGDDSLYGNDNDDYLHGGDGTPNQPHTTRPLLPLDGNDLLVGGSGKDSLDGGNGNNILDSGFDGIHELMIAGNGNDIAYVTHKEDATALDGGKNKIIKNKQLDDLIGAAEPVCVPGAVIGAPIFVPASTFAPKPPEKPAPAPRPIRKPRPVRIPVAPVAPLSTYTTASFRRA